MGYGYSGTELFIILTVYQNEATGELIWNIQKIAAQNQVFNSCERIPQYADMAKQMLEKIKRIHTNHWLQVQGIQVLLCLRHVLLFGCDVVIQMGLAKTLLSEVDQDVKTSCLTLMNPHDHVHIRGILGGLFLKYSHIHTWNIVQGWWHLQTIQESVQGMYTTTVYQEKKVFARDHCLKQKRQVHSF